MTKRHVAVLMGGPSAEREVSLESGRTAVTALRGAGYYVSPVDVQGPDFHWPVGAEVAFLALHGRFGEDGRIQRLLEERGIPYTGSGPAASELAMDKALAKAAFQQAGVPTPAYVVLERDVRQLEQMALPAMVKPAREGSSFGVTLVRERAELDRAVEQAWRYDTRIVVEEYIRGREFTVAVLDGQALPVIEIRTNRKFFDLEAKYTAGGAEEIVPAPVDAATTGQLQALAVRAQACLGCRDVSRTDILMDDRGELFVLEVNTIPGMTPASLLPKAAAAAGWTMADVCSRLVALALARRPVALPVAA